MPRKKKGGNRGDSPEKYPYFTGLGGNTEPNQGGGFAPNYPPVRFPNEQTSWVDVARQGIGTRQNVQSIEQDQTYHQLQEMFKGKIDAEIVYMVLAESQWKADDAVEKLIQLTPDSDSDKKENFSTQSHNARLFQQSSTMMPTSGYEYSDYKSKFPPADLSAQLPILSPKTPVPVNNISPDAFSKPRHEHLQPGMKAVGSYGINYGPNYPESTHITPGLQQNFQELPVSSSNFNIQPHPVTTQSQVVAHELYNTFGGIVPNFPPPQVTQHLQSGNSELHSMNQTTVYTNKSGIPTTSQSVIMQQNVSVSKSSYMPYNRPYNTSVANNQSDVYESPSAIYKSEAYDTLSKNLPSGKIGNTQSEQKLIAKKRGRKTTMSLNPEEREALENLIEDVIIGGIGDGVMDSGESSSSTESDEEGKPLDTTSSSDVPRNEDDVKQGDFTRKGTGDVQKSKPSKESKLGRDGQKSFDQGQKVYPPQLKVAVKHMKNLPPRFLRKIQTNKDDKPDAEIDLKPKSNSVRENPIPEVVEPREMKPEPVLRKREEMTIIIKDPQRGIRSKEERLIESKKKVRGMLLEGLDHYLEQSVDSDEKKHSEDPASDKEVKQTSIKHEILNDHFSHSAPSSAQVSPNARLNVTPQKSVDTSPIDPAIKAQGPTISPQIRPHLAGQQSISQPRFIGHSAPGMVINRPPAPVYLQSAAVNCEELEREMFKAEDGMENIVPVSKAQTGNYDSNLQANLHHLALSSFSAHGNLLPSATHMHYQSTLQQFQQQQAKSQFLDADAPEFIPRTFTPGAGGCPNPGLPQDFIAHPPPVLQPSQVQQNTQIPPPHIVPVVQQSSQSPQQMPHMLSAGQHIQQQNKLQTQVSQMQPQALQIQSQTSQSLQQTPQLPPMSHTQHQAPPQMQQQQQQQVPHIQQQLKQQTAQLPQQVQQQGPQIQQQATHIQQQNSQFQYTDTQQTTHMQQQQTSQIQQQAPQMQQQAPQLQQQVSQMQQQAHHIQQSPQLQQQVSQMQQPTQLPQQIMSVPVSKAIGRLSPHVVPNVSTMAGPVFTQEQIVAGASHPQPQIGRNSPIPGGPAFVLPKVPQNMPSPHTAIPPHGAPSVGLMYAPVATGYPQFRPGAYPQIPLQGPFLVQAWPGGRKNHTNQLHPSHPVSQKISGMVLRGRSGSNIKSSYSHGHAGVTQKLPHRSQHEMSPHQAKEKVQILMKQGKKVMVILRGLPGSGKSTIAIEIKLSGEVLSTDEFFTRDGVYEYDFGRLPEAHEWNQRKAKEAIEKGTNPIIIDNTNTQSWEMKAYVGLALRYDYHIEIIEPNTEWKFKVKELVQKNNHNVHVDTIQKMFDRYEKHMTIERIMGHYEKRKDDGEKQVDDPDGDKRTPRRRRRRRRRRKKKTTNDGNSDSDKAEDERSSDEEQMSIKQNMRTSSIISTDTTENELERLAVDNSVAKSFAEKSQPGNLLVKMSSSSLDSEDLTIALNTLETNMEIYEEIIEEDKAPEVTEKEIDQIDSDLDPQKETENEGEPSLEQLVCDKEDFENITEQNTIADQVKSALCKELETSVREQIVDNFVREEINKLTDSAVDSICADGNGISVNQALRDELSTKVTEQDCNVDNDILSEEDQAKEDWEFINIEGEEGGKVNTNVKTINGIIKPDCNTTVEVLNQDTVAVEDLKTVENVNQNVVPAEKQYWEGNIAGKDQYCVDIRQLPNKMHEPHSQVSKFKDNGIDDEHTNNSVICETHTNQLEEPKEQRSPRKREKTLEKTDADSDNWEVNTNNVVNLTSSQEQSLAQNDPGDVNLSVLGNDLKNNMLSANWSIPAYSGYERTVDLLSALNEEKVESKIAFCNIDVGVNTSASDFSAVHKLLQGSSDPKLVENYKVLTAVERVITSAADDCNVSSVDESPSRPVIKLNLHKGCMTEELAEEKDGLNFLKACFPAVPGEDLENILTTCSNNTEWAVNILLDSGYEYSEQAEIKTDPLCSSVIVNNITVNNENVTGEKCNCSNDDLLCKEYSKSNSDNDTVIYNNALCNGTSIDSNLCTDSKNILKIENQNSNIRNVQLIQTADVTDNNLLTNSSKDVYSHVCSSPAMLLDICYHVLQTIMEVNDTITIEQFSSQSMKKIIFIKEFSERVVARSSYEDLEIISDTDDSLNTSFCKKDAINEIADTVFPNVNVASLKAKSENDNKNTMFNTDKTYLHMNGDTNESSEYDPKDVFTDHGDLTLNLSVDLAFELIKEFGPVGFHISPESLSKADLHVRLNRRTAKQIHRRWALTMQDKFTLEEAAIMKMMNQVSSDEALARKLQAEEDHALVCNLSKKLPAKSSAVSTQPRVLSPKKPPPVVGLGGGIGGSSCSTADSPSHHSIGPSLKEIMDEEFMIEKSKKDYEMQNYGDIEKTLSTKLKRQKLHERFPTLDASALDEIFNANGYVLESTVKVVEGTLSQAEPVKTVMTAEAASLNEENILQQALKESLDQMWLGTDDDIDGNINGKIYQTFEDPSYQNYRAEASLHYQLRQECFQKAQDAYRRGMKPVASFYSQQGHLHTEKLKEANHRAADKLMEYRTKQLCFNPNTLDLHGLHVDEALRLLSQQIKKREIDMKKNTDKRTKYLSVVTGQGKHSRGGQARIKPAVTEFLNKNRYLYTEPQAGILRINLKHTDS